MKKYNVPVADINDMRIYVPHSAKGRKMPYESIELYENVVDNAPMKIYHHERTGGSVEG